MGVHSPYFYRAKRALLGSSDTFIQTRRLPNRIRHTDRMSLLSASKVLILLGITSSVNAQRGSRFPFGSKGESPEEVVTPSLLILIVISSISPE
jgi:hypothetical protein